jgi:hypothetical protein
MIAEVAITPRSSTTPSITRGVPDDESVLDDVEDSVAEEAVGGAEGVDDFADGVLSDVVGCGAVSEGLGCGAVAA